MSSSFSCWEADVVCDFGFVFSQVLLSKSVWLWMVWLARFSLIGITQSSELVLLMLQILSIVAPLKVLTRFPKVLANQIQFYPKWKGLASLKFLFFSKLTIFPVKIKMLSKFLADYIWWSFANIWFKYWIFIISLKFLEKFRKKSII